MIELSLVKTLRRETGAGMRYCKRALELTNDDLEVAKAYIRLKSQPVSRKKTVKGGHMVPWDDADYLREAFMEVENETAD